MLIPRHWRIRLLTVGVLLLVAWGAGVIVRSWNHYPGVADQQLRLGDSREQLIELIGRPDIVTPYSHPPGSPAAGVEESYEYSDFYENWKFTFRDDRLIRKEHCVLEEYCQSAQ